MNIKVNIEKNNKDFQILEDNQVIIKGIKPKWYSQQIRFFYNNRTYEIKKKSFWSSEHIILRSGSLIGSIPFNWKKGHSIELDEQNGVKKQYWLEEKKKGGTFSSDKIYTLLEGGTKSILEIHYSWKKWKEHMEIEILDKNDDSYELLIYALYLMRQQQQAAAASAPTFVGG